MNVTVKTRLSKRHNYCILLKFMCSKIKSAELNHQIKGYFIDFYENELKKPIRYNFLLTYLMWVGNELPKDVSNRSDFRCT